MRYPQHWLYVYLLIVERLFERIVHLKKFLNLKLFQTCMTFLLCIQKKIFWKMLVTIQFWVPLISIVFFNPWNHLGTNMLQNLKFAFHRRKTMHTGSEQHKENNFGVDCPFKGTHLSYCVLCIVLFLNICNLQDKTVRGLCILGYGLKCGLLKLAINKTQIVSSHSTSLSLNV